MNEHSNPEQELDREPGPQDPTPAEAPPSDGRRRFLATLLGLGLTQVAVSFVGNSPSAGPRPQPPDDAQDGCGTPNPDGTVVEDTTCNLVTGGVSEMDDDCGKPSETPNGDPMTMSDSDCGTSNGYVRHKDDACGKPVGAPQPENVMTDGDCAKPDWAHQHQDNDCGFYTNGHLNNDDDCFKPGPAGSLWSDNDCGKPLVPEGELYAGDKDCGSPPHPGSPTRRKDDDCGKQGEGGMLFSDEDCGKPSSSLGTDGGYLTHTDDGA